MDDKLSDMMEDGFEFGPDQTVDFYCGRCSVLHTIGIGGVVSLITSGQMTLEIRDQILAALWRQDDPT
jgi:hypothetical protein